nr:hypothetical protein [Tanacetum cinerariifolium]
MNDIFDDSSNDPLLEEVNLFLASDNLIPSGIRNIDDNLEGDIRFLEELLIDDSIPNPVNESSDFDNQDDPLFLRSPPEPPDVEFDFEPEDVRVGSYRGGEGAVVGEVSGGAVGISTSSSSSSPPSV